MPPDYKQDARLLSLTTPLGKDVLLLGGFSGSEALSRLFSFRLEMFSAKPDLAAKDIVGKAVSWSVKFQDKQPRHFHGLVSRFAAAGSALQGLHSYSAEVVPWLWLLTRTSNCRIFQNKSLPDIIKQVFQDHGFTDFKLDLKETYRKWEYCVQYRETAFNFVSRLMEQAGIWYAFVHEAGKHTLLLADHKGAYKACADGKAAFGTGQNLPQLSSWSRETEFRPGKWAHTDYNFEIPSTPLLAKTNTVSKLPGQDKFEVFDFPGEYPLKADGDAEVKVRMEEDEAPGEVVHSGGTSASFFPGGKFSVEGHVAPGEAGKGYVLTSVQHSATDPSSRNADGPSRYENSFTAIPDGTLFRPARQTPKPAVVGTQPAVVVGPKGQELYTDKYGRVKVHFFWDRESKRDENSSCWLRVAQVMAGKRWGASFWPRIGQEVLVAFHEGDPDRPVVVGMLYNAEQMPPYQGDGPDGAHKSDNKVSGYKSNSTMGGAGYNEWRFDDNAGKEQVFLHAERDMDTRVKNDSRELVLKDRHLTIGSEKDKGKQGDQIEEVWRHKELHVHNHQVEWIEGSYVLTVGKGQATSAGMELLVEKDRWQTIGGEDNLHVTKDRKEQVDGALSLTVGGDINTKGGMNINEEAGMCIHIKAGMALILEAGAQLSLKVGGSFVDIGPAGVAISGPMVMINSGGAAGSGPGASPVAPGDAEKAQPTKPDLADDAKSGQKSVP
ncbi:MAG: type VI secretion system tip protein VgrG [Gemmataceae bacterium]|nr:type VI secretion system tip protein VgrG [Gemmataceae bacterium]